MSFSIQRVDIRITDLGFLFTRSAATKSKFLVHHADVCSVIQPEFNFPYHFSSPLCAIKQKLIYYTILYYTSGLKVSASITD
jgi:hypothetical protein